MASVAVDTVRGLRVTAVLRIRPESSTRIAEFMTALIAVEGVSCVVKQAAERDLAVLIRAADGAGLDRSVAKLRGLAAERATAGAVGRILPGPATPAVS